MKTYIPKTEPIFFMGKKLWETFEGFWRDEFGTVFDISTKKITRQVRPGVWVWERNEPRPQREFPAMKVSGDFE